MTVLKTILGYLLPSEQSEMDEITKLTKDGIPVYPREAFSLLKTTQEGTYGVCYQSSYKSNSETFQALIKTIR